jgi:hypothetical protein
MVLHRPIESTPQTGKFRGRNQLGGYLVYQDLGHNFRIADNASDILLAVADEHRSHSKWLPVVRVKQRPPIHETERATIKVMSSVWSPPEKF